MKQNIWLCIVAIVLAACGGGDGSGEETISKDYINVNPNRELNFSGDGGNNELTISANCSWEITVSASAIDWLTVSPSSGNKDQKVKVTASKNTTGVDRFAKLTIQGGTAPAKTVSVFQVKANIERSLSVNPNALSFEAKGESKTFTISSNTNWSITKPEWCTVSETSGSGNATITVTAAENPNQEQRTGQIVISGEDVADVTVAVSQKAKSSLSVNLSSLSFEAKGESKTFNISSNTNWNITKPDWCSISKTSGSGNATITVTASENPNQEQRSGQIVISGDNVADATIAVSQKAKESNDNQEPGKDDNQPPS